MSIPENEGETHAEQSPLANGHPISSDGHQDSATDENAKERVTFLRAWLIPRVFLYSATLFCVKLATNSMLLWMPLLLKEYKGYTVH